MQFEVFGRGGSTTIDVESDGEAWPRVKDMHVLSDGGIVLAGAHGWQLPFVARLLGDSSGGGPGVADFAVSSHEVSEPVGSVDIGVRRIGGFTGAVSVEYEVESAGATAGAHFGHVAGQLTWGDDDDAEKVITIPIFTDGGPAERPEKFAVLLAAPGGGLGLATRTAQVTILGDSIRPGSSTSPPAPWSGRAERSGRSSNARTMPSARCRSS